MARSWTEDHDLLHNVSENVLQSMSSYPRKLVHTDELVHKHDLPFMEIQLIAILASREMTIPEASRTINVATTNLASLTRHLINRGYVEREIDPSDKRRGILHLTALGYVEYEKIRESVEEQLKKNLSLDLARTDILVLLKAVKQINDILNRI